MNEYLQDFRSLVRSRFAEDSVKMPMSEWMVRNTKFKKKPFSFEGFEFQKQIADDMHPNMAVIKCSQIGLTEIQIRKFLGFLARNTAISGIFSLPNDDMYRRVSSTRVRPLVDTEPVFNLGGVEKPVRRTDLYQINHSFGYFVGNKESDATSINADLLFHDEVDLSDQEMLGLFQSRLQGSDYRITHNFSTPTFEGFGIDALYQVSDQHEYMVRCTKCNTYNIPQFTPKFVTIPNLSSDINDLTEIDRKLAEKLDLGASYIRCEACGNPLNLRDPSLRQWVPRFPGRRGRGYRVSPFCVPKLTIPYIIDQLVLQKEKDNLRRFYNTVLGLPFNDSNVRLTDNDIIAVMKSPSSINPSNWPVFLGIDVGITCHIVLIHMGQDQPVVFDWRQVLAENLEDEVSTILDTFNVVGGSIDRHPYTPLSNTIRDLSMGRIVPTEYASSPTSAAISIVKDELDEVSHIRANRTMMIDTVAGLVRKRKTTFVGYKQFEHVIIQHLKDMNRIEKPDEGAVWQKMTGNDHFFHALAHGFFSMKVHDALVYRSDADERNVVLFSSLVIPTQNNPNLGMQSRRRETISLGHLN